MWIYGSYRHWGTYNTVAGSFKDADFSAFVLRAERPNRTCSRCGTRAPWRASPRRSTSRTRSTSTTTGSTPTSATASCRRISPPSAPALSTRTSRSTSSRRAGARRSPTSCCSRRAARSRRRTSTATGAPACRRRSSRSPIRWRPPAYPTTWGSSTGYGANRSDQIELPRLGVLRHRLARRQGRASPCMHAWRYTTQEPNNSVALALRARQPFSLTQYATPIQFHETLNYNMGIYAQDQWRIKPPDDELRRAARLPERARRRAATSRRAVHAGAAASTPSRTCRTGRTSIRGSASPTTCSATARPPSRSASDATSSASRTRSRRAVEPDAVDGQHGDAHLEQPERHLQPVQRLRPDEPGGEQQVPRAGRLRADQQPAVRPGGHAHDELRSRRS